MDGRSLALECWGYWEDDVIAAFARIAGAALETLTALTELTIDAALLKPQSSSGQDALLVFMRRAAEKKPAKTGIRVDNVLTQMQLTRLASQSGLGSVRFSNLQNPSGR